MGRDKEKARPVIPETMRAAVVEKFREPLQIREVPVPSPGPGQALVQIIATGVCHTDLHAADGDWPVKPTPPFIPGHEGAGVVVALGPGVTHLKEGDRVGIAWLHSACGHCEFCVSGWETLCKAQQNSGYSVNGSFARDLPSRRQISSAEFPTSFRLSMRDPFCAQASRRIKA